MTRYSDFASGNVPLPTRRRRDVLLEFLRSADEPMTTAEIVERSAERLGWNNALIAGDLRALQRFRLVIETGWPSRHQATLWKAREDGGDADV